MPPARCAQSRTAASTVVSPARCSGCSADARALSQQQIARRLIRPVAAQAVVGDILADPHQRVGHHLRRRHSLCANTASGWRPAVSWRFLMSTVLSVERDRLDRAELGAADIAELLAAAKLGLLRRKAVAVDRRLCGAADRADKVEAGESGAFIEQILGREIGQPEILPPDRLLFPAVPVEDVGQDPAGLLLLRSALRDRPERRPSVFRSAR